MKPKRRIVLAGVSILLLGCGSKSGPTGEDFQDIPADMIMTDLDSYMTASGIRKAHLQGDTAHMFEDSSKLAITAVRLSFFDEQGNDSGSLTSLTGDLNTSTQVMIARGNVVLITKVGNRRIETEELHYDPQAKRIWSDVKTLMIEGGSRITGDGFSADDKFTNVQVRNARGRVEGAKIQF